MRNDRQREFRASNGKEYKWKLGFLTPEVLAIITYFQH